VRAGATPPAVSPGSSKRSGEPVLGSPAVGSSNINIVDRTGKGRAPALLRPCPTRNVRHATIDAPFGWPIPVLSRGNLALTAGSTPFRRAELTNECRLRAKSRANLAHAAVASRASRAAQAWLARPESETPTEKRRAAVAFHSQLGARRRRSGVAAAKRAPTNGAEHQRRKPGTSRQGPADHRPSGATSNSPRS